MMATIREGRCAITLSAICRADAATFSKLELIAQFSDSKVTRHSRSTGETQEQSAIDAVITLRQDSPQHVYAALSNFSERLQHQKQHPPSLLFGRWISRRLQTASLE